MESQKSTFLVILIFITFFFNSTDKTKTTPEMIHFVQSNWVDVSLFLLQPCKGLEQREHQFHFL